MYYVNLLCNVNGRMNWNDCNIIEKMTKVVFFNKALMRLALLLACVGLAMAGYKSGGYGGGGYGGGGYGGGGYGGGGYGGGSLLFPCLI